MPKGLALTIGLNYVDPLHYVGWDGKLKAAENDANDMADLVKSEGFQVTTLLREKATRDAVIGSIRSAGQVLDPGDILMISYSGHGGQVRDVNRDERDNLDETWCLYDGQLIDDELDLLWTDFKTGVRILVLSDSCHSGTVTKAAQTLSSLGTLGVYSDFVKQLPYSSRCMPDDLIYPVYRANKDFYDGLQKDIPKKEDLKAKTKATNLLISGCQDTQSSGDGPINGVFTGTLLNVWSYWKNSGGNYLAFHGEIVSKMPPYQVPNYYLVGVPNVEFERQRPFTI